MWLGGEDQDEAWLDGPVASVKGKLVGLAPMDRRNGEEQVRSRSMDQKPCDDMEWIISLYDRVDACVASTSTEMEWKAEGKGIT